MPGSAQAAQPTGDDLQQIGLFQIEVSQEVFLRTMRDYAAMLIRLRGWATTDDLRSYADQKGIQPEHRNAWGTIFKDSRFTAIGSIKSQRPSNHGRMIRKWGLL